MSLLCVCRYMHGLPDWVHYAEVLFTFAGELLVPFLVFCGPLPRAVCLAVHTTLCIGIWVTGNYGFLHVCYS